jgi:hypothetical protein
MIKARPGTICKKLRANVIASLLALLQSQSEGIKIDIKA